MEKKMMSSVLELETIIMDMKALKGMILALEEALFYAGNWDKENYRYMVSHMYKTAYDIENDLTDTFNELQENKGVDTNGK